LDSTDTLYRLALPAACGPLAIENAVGDLALEWHGQQRWIKAPGDDATFASLKALAHTHGGHATRFRQGANVDPSNQRFTLLSEQAHSFALEAVQERLRSAFDPAGVFATKRLP
jgi:glycolate oxidase FAD binding subunit